MLDYFFLFRGTLSVLRGEVTLQNADYSANLAPVTRFGRVTLKMYSDSNYLLKNVVSNIIQVSHY